MSTPVIWIFLPFFIAVLLFFLRRWYRTTVLVGSLTMILLAVTAWIIPINQFIRLGPIVFKIEEQFNILGRQLTLGVNDRNLVVMIFALTAFWFSAAYKARAGRLFIPVGMAMVAIWIAALAVEPFLYAALLLELAVLLSILLLTPTGFPPARGAIRYLILQTFGMPFILLTGWLLAGVESSPGDLDLVIQASILLGLGFVFLLGIFPFHTWIPMLSEETHPYAAGFIFFFLPLMVILFGLSFIDQFAWLRESDAIYELLRVAGVLMMVIGGAWAALQRHLGRIMGFAVMASTGSLLLSISEMPSLDLFFAMQIPRALGFALWALGLSMLRNKMVLEEKQGAQDETLLAPTTSRRIETYPLLRYINIYGIGRDMPVATAAITLGTFSLAGYPLLASFPLYQTIWYHLSLETSGYAVLALSGCLLLGIAGLRSASVLVTGDHETPWRISENWDTVSLFIIGMFLNILLGLFPQWVLPIAAKISITFTQLAAQASMP